MSSTLRRTLLLTLLFAIAGFSSMVGAGELPPVEPGFTRIFNGVDLSGWKVVNGREASWQVRDGDLEASQGGDWVVSEKKYGDFILRLDFKISENGNSGVFIRVPADDDEMPWETGFEAQISNQLRDPTHCTGTLYGVVGIGEALKKMSRAEWHSRHEAADVWHSYEIICLGNAVTVRVDNVECVSTNADIVAALGSRPRTGFIGLQDSHNETGVVRFSNVRVAELNKDGLVAGFQQLAFPGRETGWHKITTGHGSGGNWRMIDGAWVGEQDPPGSGNGGVLLTDQRFKDFELVIEANPDWGCCSGIFLRSTQKGNCYQIMVDHHGTGNVGSIYGEGTGGFSNRNYSLNPEMDIVPVDGPEGNIPFPIAPEEWRRRWNYDGFNEIRARVVGDPPEIETWLNGVYITKFKDDQKREQIDDDGRGAVGIQVHGGKSWPNGKVVRYRNVQVRELR